MKWKSLLCLIVLTSVLSEESLSNTQGITVTRTVQGSSPALRVSWSAVSGSGITYTVCYTRQLGTQPIRWSRGNCPTSGITGTSTILGPLSGGTTYLIWVTVVSSGGQRPHSGNVELKACNVPSRPTLPAVYHTLYSPSEVGISVSWKAPQSDCNITSYEVQYKISSDTSWSTPPLSKTSGSRKHDWRGLSPNTRYDVRVRAVSEPGKGAWSDVGQATTPGGPPSFTVTQLTGQHLSTSSVTLRISPSVGSRYVVFYREDGQQFTKHPTTFSSANNVVITGLQSNTGYTMRVQASNDYGSTNSSDVDVYTLSEGTNPTGAIVGVLLAIGLIVTVAVVAVIIILCVKKKKTPVCLSGGMTKVQGVRDAVKRKQKDEDYEHSQPEVVYYHLSTVGSLEPIPQSNFSVHVKAMHMERECGFEREYQTIVNDPNGSAEIAMENRPKNRYLNIHTYDHSRVVLSAPDENGSDYINASYIDGYEKRDAYIASQGPKVDIISDFWEMVWEQKSPVIVMLTKVEEKGKVKCEQYWCEELDKPYELKRNLTVTTRSHNAMADYEIRDIRVVKHDDLSSKPLEVVHMQYTAWPDHGVPAHPSSLVKFVQQVRKEYKDSTAPMVVHCSAGVGRTGTFITIDAMMERLKEKDDLNIYQFVTEMRSKRTFMVQTMDQYAFIHDALCDYLTCGDTTIPAHQLTAKIIEMSAVKEETNTTEFQDQFKFLESLSKNTSAEDNAYSKKTTIAKKNRYKDKFPYSNCHLMLHSRNSTNGRDYINASFIDSFSRSKAFIAAQAPLENTKNDVWQLIWQFKIPTVVVLCGFKEERQETCCRFWPDETIKSMECDHIKVNHDSTIPKTGYEVTKLDAFEKGMDTNQVIVTLFHVNNWSKSGSVDLNLFLKLMGDVEGAHTKKKKPIMVMCDDGMGRSGVFICAMSEVERVKVERQVDVFQTIKGMRIQRPHMVDTPEHYKLCFDILLTHLNSFDTYANFKVV